MMRLMVSVASIVCSVERHEVADLGCGQRGGHGLVVAHLADEDDVGVLPHDVSERIRVAVGVDADLALVDDALLVLVQDLDRVLDGDDVAFARAS